MPPEKHALLSASSASRWLVCTAAPRFEEGLPESTSSYAEEGRLAHAIAELKVLKKFTIMTNRTFNSRLNKLKKEELYDPEIDDSFLRQVFTYRFISGLPWRQVAACIGGGNTEDGCRKAVKRYLEQN